MSSRVSLVLWMTLLASCGGATAESSSAHRDPAVPPSSPQADAASGRPLTAREIQKIEPLVHAAEEIRNLRFAQPVPMQVQSAAAIRASMASELEDEDLLENRNFYVALGLLDPSLDVRELLLDVLGEQVVGYYDTKRHRLTLREDVMSQSFSFGSGRQVSMESPAMVIVHELVHALQDQALGLSAAEEVDRSDDAGNAFHAVVEGDATLAMVGHLMSRNGVPLFMLAGQVNTLRQLMSQQPQQAAPGSEALMHAPAIVRVPLMSAYIDGMLFCTTVYGQRGGWTAVDQAHREPPASTEQILHPEKYLVGERPDAIAIPPLTALESAGYRTLQDDTVGELEMSVYFALGTNDERNTEAAMGWGGDRVRVVQSRNGTLGAVWFTSWDTEPEAVEAENAARAIFTRQAIAAIPHRELRVGRALLMTRNIDDASANTEIESAFRAFAASLPAR